MTQLKVTIIGADAVIVRLGQNSAARWERIKRATQAAGADTQKAVMRDRLSGTPVGVQTGRLRRSITADFEADENRATSTIGTNVEYAARVEFGFRGEENVRSYVRRVKSRDVRGMVENEYGIMRRRITRAGSATVRAHKRRVNQKERPFLRPELKLGKSRLLERVKKAAGGSSNVH